MWVKAYVDEKADGMVEVFVKTDRGFYKLWVHPDKKVEVMIDGVLKGRAKAKLKRMKEED